MDAVMKLNPAGLRFRNNGEKINVISTLKLIKKGVEIPSRKLFIQVLTEQYGNLSDSAKKELLRSWVFSSTLYVMGNGDCKLREKTVFTSGNVSITFIADNEAQEKYYLTADLTSGNFGLDVDKKNKRATIYGLKSEDVGFSKPPCVFNPLGNGGVGLMGIGYNFYPNPNAPPVFEGEVSQILAPPSFRMRVIENKPIHEEIMG